MTATPLGTPSASVVPCPLPFVALTASAASTVLATTPAPLSTTAAVAFIAIVGVAAVAFAPTIPMILTATISMTLAAPTAILSASTIATAVTLILGSDRMSCQQCSNDN